MPRRIDPRWQILQSKNAYGASLRRMGGEPCAYCGHAMAARGGGGNRRYPTRDHVLPHRYSQPTPTEIVCRQCNADKANWSPQTWLAILRVNNDPRAERFAAILEKWGYEIQTSRFSKYPAEPRGTPDRDDAGELRDAEARSAGEPAD